MTSALLALAIVSTIAAAVRSTWSPCGWSMLSTVTPLGEKGRGRSYPVTATWFIAGAMVGGAVLGAAMAALAGAVASVGPVSRTAAIGVGGLAALVGAASDARVAGFSLPFHRRQVNEDWLDLYRPWVYGAGFGFQIGRGFATYITTAAVYLMAVLGALTGQPLMAGMLGALFGIARGLAVLVGRHLDTSEAMRSFHRRFDAAGEVSRRATIGVQAGAGLVALTVAFPRPPIAAAYAVVCAVTFVSLRRGRALPSRSSRSSLRVSPHAAHTQRPALPEAT